MKDNIENFKGFVCLISLKPLSSFIVNKFCCLLCHTHHFSFYPYSSWDMFIFVLDFFSCCTYVAESGRIWNDLNNIIFVRKSMLLLMFLAVIPIEIWYRGTISSKKEWRQKAVISIRNVSLCKSRNDNLIFSSLLRLPNTFNLTDDWKPKSEEAEEKSCWQ